MNIETVKIPPTQGNEIIIGQANFSLKTVEDIALSIISSTPGAKVGVAMNDGDAGMTRHCGNDKALEKRATDYCYKIGAGHVFVVVVSGAFPSNFLNNLTLVPGVCRIMAASGNPLEVVVGQTETGNVILGVADGATASKVEDDAAKAARRETLSKIGYKLD